MDTPEQSAQQHEPPHASHSSSHSIGSNGKKRKPNKKIPKQHRVGNFRSYYTFRLGQSRQGELEDDPRLSALEKAWFCGKRGLDIGCNSGDLTIAIAKKMEPAYLLGIDVDAQLVSRARSNLKDLLQQEQIKKAFDTIAPVSLAATATVSSGAPDTPVTSILPVHKADSSMSNGSTSDKTVMETEAMAASTEGNGDKSTSSAIAVTPSPFATEMPLSFRLWKPPMQATMQLPKALGKATTGTSFPANVVFKREDIVTDTHAGKDYDFITCFSVTKWIHLFHGDDGIKGVFAQIHQLLAPGGRFIVEPQPWKSYHKRKFTSEVTAANYQKIELRPKDFPAFLVDTIGFKKCTFLQVCRTSANGFRRPVYVVEK
ncbi:RNA methyltransferase [Globisporangium polare]